jgi:hypothetical protein
VAHGVVAEQRDEDAGSRSASIVDRETIMADGRPVLDQVNIIASDLRRSLDFYCQLGVSFPQPLENPAGKLFHASSEAEGGAHLQLDCPSFAPVWTADWAQRTDLIGRMVLGSV